jgi:Putative addiction module component
MRIEELEAEALRLDPKGRARLAGRLLESLDELTPEENTQIWADEAERRSVALDAGALSARAAADVFRDARARV